ncbi:leukocyte cell-derived chemotaxin-2 [Dromiciops gliroides]|uniref:leukocyte cell-derived chemotaxin-2 n=1 Tax=Dromiciops gliroides TaxID=33562 RepID=UPI001CC401F1|nr:leukocyte cell-derived chemotaxin-2 [Dromiciops gliroides]
MLPIRVFIFVALITTALAGPWAIICKGKVENTIRQQDKYGSGRYGDPRGTRNHTGVDVVCPDGSLVYAPFDGIIRRQAKPYRTDNAINNGVQITASSYCIQIFYILPIKYMGNIKKGELLGIVLPMQKVYPGITSHVHIQNCDRTDPTPYL